MTTLLADPSLLRDLVLSNKILAHEGAVDAFGHVSIRHPDDPGSSSSRGRSARSW